MPHSQFNITCLWIGLYISFCFICCCGQWDWCVFWIFYIKSVIRWPSSGSFSDNDFVLTFPVSQNAHRAILIPFCFLFCSVFICFFRALLFMLTGFSVTFLLTTPKSVFQYLLTQCWLSLCCVIVFMVLWFGLDVIKSRTECRQEWIVAQRAVSVALCMSYSLVT